MIIFLIVILARANIYLNKSLLLAGLYSAILLFVKLGFSLKTLNYPSLLISIVLSFGVAAGLFTLLNRFQDTIITWLVILSTGIVLLTYLAP